MDMLAGPPATGEAFGPVEPGTGATVPGAPTFALSDGPDGVEDCPFTPVAAPAKVCPVGCAPLAAVLPAGTTWDAIASIFTYHTMPYNPYTYVNASDNAPAYADIPIYNTEGQLVASGAGQFYGTDSLTNPIDYDQNGSLNAEAPVWTGSISGGIADTDNAPQESAYGYVVGNYSVDNGVVTDAVLSGTTDLWDPSHLDPTDEASLFVLSSPITVSVPEPTTAGLMSLGLFGVLGRRRRSKIVTVEVEI
jgi:hypothetical protein